MNNKKILLSFLLVVLMALSLSMVSAADDVDEIVAADDVDDAIAVDDSVDVLAEDAASPKTIAPTENTSDAVQAAINSANETDTIDLSAFDSYDFKNVTVTVTKSNIIIKGNIETTIYGHGGPGNGLFDITGSNVVIEGIQFINTNPANNLVYNGTVSGWGVRFMGVNGATVQNCEFTDFNQAIRAQRSSNVLITNNGFYGGMATKLVNDPSVNKEEGSKTVSIMGSSDITVTNNYFAGPMLDGISIASGSGDSLIQNNTFVGNAYAIYFGGASTAGCVIADNTFIRCGSFNETDVNGKRVFMEGFPVISIQKSSDNIVFTGNEFQAVANSVLIAAEAGNTAHGGATQIGNVTVVANKVVPYEEGGVTADVSNVTLFHVDVKDSDVLDLTAPLNVTENVYEGPVTGVAIYFNGNLIFSAANAYLNETLDANHIYGADTLYTTTLTVSDVKGYAGDIVYLVATLKDSKGIGLYNKQIKIFLNDNEITAYTDNDGKVEIPIREASATVKYASAVFLGEGNMYAGSYDSAKVTFVKKATALTAKKATLKVKKVKKIKVTLKSQGKALAKKQVTIKVNGKTFKAKTNAKGVATIKVKVTKKGKFNAVVKFAGDGAYNAVTKKVKYTVKK